MNSQDLPFRKEVNYIDSVLQSNPSMENFLGITYYYSIDITAEKELIVVMDFKGPFTTTSTARLADLNYSFVVDTSEYRQFFMLALQGRIPQAWKKDALNWKICIHQEKKKL